MKFSKDFLGIYKQYKKFKRNNLFNALSLRNEKRPCHKCYVVEKKAYNIAIHRYT